MFYNYSSHDILFNKEINQFITDTVTSITFHARVLKNQ